MKSQMAFRRHLLTSRMQIATISRMNFSSNLLVPIAGKQDLPAEFHNGFTRNDQFLKEIHDKHAAFNELCKTQLIEMNTNKINAIEDRSGDAGWTQQIEGDTPVALTKTFEFETFEKAQAFIQMVNVYCD